MSTTGEAISERCAAIRAGLGEAIEWVSDVRRTAPQLDRDAAGLIEKLRRSRNLLRRLGGAAGRPLSVGVFGMSQAGKSYLISSLARPADGELQTVLDGTRFSFIGHINPPGGGKEATGLVTRFTRRPTAGPPGYPIELRLFSEADLIKILGNTFFRDFDRDRVSVATDAEEIHQHLARFEPLRQPRSTGGLDEDDVVDVRDYFEKGFGKPMEPFRGDFWPTVIELAPRLAAAQRGALLSLLWGGIDELTQVYVRLRDALARLSNAPTVYVPLEALVLANEQGYEWNRDGLINVDVLNQLGRDDASPLRVLPVTGAGPLAEVSVARSVLAALTAEMTFALADPPMAPLLERVDLLDFPGYRGRLKVKDLAEVGTALKQENANPVKELLLRGKVAYLFERYTDDQEMNLLLMCTESGKQIEITDLAPALDAWVHATQGETPALRGERRAGLAWVLTKFDTCLEVNQARTSASQQRELWSSLIHTALLERFAACDWLHEWAAGRPFDNVFLVRNPSIVKTFIQYDGRREAALAAGDAERLGALRAMFLEEERVALHVRDAAAAWDAVLTLNDGGMRRLAAFLEQAAVEGAKLSRIEQQLQRTVEEIAVQWFGRYYFAEGAGEVEKKEALAAAVAAALEERFDCVGELLWALQPDAEQLRQLYLRSDARPEDAPAPGAGQPAPDARPRRAGLVRPALPTPGGTGQPEKRPVVAGRATLFAQAVMSAWIRQLRTLPDDARLQRHLDLAPAILQPLANELVSGASRLRLEEQLIGALQPQEEKRATTREGIVDQQVLLARMIVNGFLDTLGVEAMPLDQRPASTVGARRIFEPPLPIPPRSLPHLPPEEIPYTYVLVADWLVAFRQLAIGNVGHSAGREITPEQNQRLGAILDGLRTAGADTAAGAQ